MRDVSFQQVVEFVATYWRVDRKRALAPATELERDLGVTGDDGAELLQAFCSRFDVDFQRRATPGLFLFDAEGFDPITPLVRWILRRPAPRILPITLGHLHNVAMQGKWVDPPLTVK